MGSSTSQSADLIIMKEWDFMVGAIPTNSNHF
jgi:hypothetical protein